MAFCQNCGTELPEGAAFCPGCGAAVPGRAEERQIAPEQTKERPVVTEKVQDSLYTFDDAKPAKKKKGRGRAGKVVLLIVLAFVVILFIGAFGNKSSKNKKASEVAKTETMSDHAADDVTDNSAEEQTDTQAAKEETENAEDEPAKEQETEESKTSSEEQEASAGVDPNLKETLNAYERMMNEYCDFMEKYENADSSDVFSMLGDYSKMMSEYADAMDKLNELDTSKMSTADYKYYLDVTTRVSKRLLDVAS